MEHLIGASIVIGLIVFYHFASKAIDYISERLERSDEDG